MTDIPVREFGRWDMWVHRDDDPREAGRSAWPLCRAYSSIWLLRERIDGRIGQ